MFIINVLVKRRAFAHWKRSRLIWFQGRRDQE
uniref:Uncharacterized protein n=1 Tax=Rhizophora mucronata TaxID=61149 RepID=A0A2P2L6X3_RHIMU